MPYKTIKHKNGFTEIIAYDLTEAEEREQMALMAGVRMFPSVNSRLKSLKKFSASGVKLTKPSPEEIKAQ
jgi:hypothetical protein